MTTKEKKQENKPNNVIPLSDAKAAAKAKATGQAGNSERVVSEAAKQQRKEGNTINTVCQTTLRVINVVQPLLTMLATNREQLAPIRDVVDAIQETLGKHVGPEQGEQILSEISKEIAKFRPERRTPEELEQLLKKIVQRIGALVLKHRAKTEGK